MKQTFPLVLGVKVEEDFYLVDTELRGEVLRNRQSGEEEFVVPFDSEGNIVFGVAKLMAQVRREVINRERGVDGP